MALFGFSLKFNRNCIVCQLQKKFLIVIFDCFSFRHDINCLHFPPRTSQTTTEPLSACKTFLFDMKRRKKFPMEKSNNLIDFITKAFVDIRKWHMRLQGWYQSSPGDTRRRKVVNSDPAKNISFPSWYLRSPSAEFGARIIFYFEAFDVVSASFS